MDDINREILQLLIQKGRLSHELIGQAVNLARPTIHKRVKQLEDQGVIYGYHAQVDWAALGYPLTVFIWVSSRNKSDDTAACLLKLSTSGVIIESCHGVVGEWCLLLQTHVISPTVLKEFIDQIYTVEGVQNTMTILSLSAYRDQCTTILPIKKAT
ncbi:Lrp/AsnC family transcriptional regulator [Pelolinea submarina]|uniref:AsnC family transcriptional regulator n=1 Tax=Pelolinea submarina TaxID=913107 RepID=A0A3E0A4B5_9CHLR|nr:Lrp/AsnC family transcriptional regulator [Pelolinea submarina]REG05430.1 AsnC family transcriptional regulator [Pelolinea submarina]